MWMSDCCIGRNVYHNSSCDNYCIFSQRVIDSVVYCIIIPYFIRLIVVWFTKYMHNFHNIFPSNLNEFSSISSARTQRFDIIYIKYIFGVFFFITIFSANIFQTRYIQVIRLLHILDNIQLWRFVYLYLKTTINIINNI